MSDGGRVKSLQSPGGWWIDGKLTIKVLKYFYPRISFKILNVGVLFLKIRLSVCLWGLGNH
jgi:hypothetical protein